MTELALAEAVPLAHALVDRAARDVDVRVLFIKGPAAVAQHLREPRPSLDVDVLVDPSRLEALRTRLAELGWVDENPYSTPTAASYSRTHRHPSWPCELDLHLTFPGLYAGDQEVFELLWSRRDSVVVAGRGLPCPDVRAHALLLALNSLRDPHDLTKTAWLESLVERVAGGFDAASLIDLGQLAGNVGAADTASPFLSAVGAPNDKAGSTSPPELQAWRLRTQPAWRVATWMNDLRRQPLRALPAYLWRAVMLSEAELRMSHPDLAPGRLALVALRWRRFRRGLVRAPEAWRALRKVRTDKSPNGRGQDPFDVLTSLVCVLDRWWPFKSGVVVRTFPDFEDQGLAICAELVARGARITWLTIESDAGRLRRLAPAVASAARVVPARSPRGAWAYVTARSVVHTHGLYRMPDRSKRKQFINLWHGMPIKRLNDDPAIAARQTDVLTVTSDSHARHFAEAWHLTDDRIHTTGLPRNDRMLRAAQEPRPSVLAQRVGDRPLVLWLPTYRNSVVGEIRRDGADFGNPFQLPQATTGRISAMAQRLGVHVVVKLHPMAPAQQVGEYPFLSVWDEEALDEHGVTMYQLLGHADLLITDHSSVWVDFLLLDRPIIFAIADLESYATNRGHYFAPLQEHVPGPIVADIEKLEQELSVTRAHDPKWAAVREKLRPVHHAWLDDHSARRVARLIW